MPCRSDGNVVEMDHYIIYVVGAGVWIREALSLSLVRVTQTTTAGFRHRRTGSIHFPTCWIDRCPTCSHEIFFGTYTHPHPHRFS